jgi:RNA polymerase sigma-70 factor (ECF subfamily)
MMEHSSGNQKIMDADTEVFLKVKKGDEQAFRKLYKKFYPKILNLIFRFISDRGHAEDIAQEVFIRAYFGAKTFYPQAKFSTWLYKIAVNRCFSHCKKIRYERERYVNESVLSVGAEDISSLTFENRPSSLPTPEEHIVRDEFHQEIRSALNKLPPDQKMAFILREYSGLSYQEIARISGASVKAVERRIYRARGKLKTLLKKYISS